MPVVAFTVFHANDFDIAVLFGNCIAFSQEEAGDCPFLYPFFLFQSKTIENIDLRISTSACNIAVVASSILTSKVNAANMALSIPLFMGQ